MGRGRRGLLDDLAVLPWPVGLVVGVFGFALIRYGVPAWASRQPGPLAQAVGQNDAFATLAWVVFPCPAHPPRPRRSTVAVRGPMVGIGLANWST